MNIKSSILLLISIIVTPNINYPHILNLFEDDQEINLLKSDTNFKKLNRTIPEQFKLLLDYYKNPAKYNYASPFVGIMLYGDPGTGKTEYVRALAGEKIPVLACSATSIMNGLYGQSEKNIRNLYKKANDYTKKGFPCVIVFIDEIDSIASKRTGNNAHSTEINQLLASMDGVTKNNNIITIINTNLPKVIDGALKRSGRIDLKIKVNNPTIEEKRQVILQKFNDLKLPISKDLKLYLNSKNNMEHLSIADCASLPKIAVGISRYLRERTVSFKSFQKALQWINEN